MPPYVNTLRFAVFWWLVGSGLVALVIYGSLATGAPTMGITVSDKILHLGAYGILGTYFSGLVTNRALWVVLVLFMLMSIALEFLQGAGGQREFEVYDMVFNGLGLMLALVASKLGMRYWCQSIERVLA